VILSAAGVIVSLVGVHSSVAGLIGQISAISADAVTGLCQRVYSGALPASPALADYAGSHEVEPDSKRRVGGRAPPRICRSRSPIAVFAPGQGARSAASPAPPEPAWASAASTSPRGNGYRPHPQAANQV
jgi:hypothetical protein